MTNLISKGLVFFEVDKEMLFEVLEILIINFRNIFFDIGERISDIFLAPASCVQKDVDDGLFFNQHLVGLILNPLRNSRGLSIVNTMWWRLPVVLDRCPMRVTYEDAASVCGLHRVSQKGCHV